MTIRTFLLDPPDKAAVLQRDGTIGLSWLQYFNFLSQQAGRLTLVDATVDPPSLGADARSSTTLTVPGARLGDFAWASFSQADGNVLTEAKVSATNTVTVWFRNYSAGTVDLASGTVRVLVWSAR